MLIGSMARRMLGIKDHRVVKVVENGNGMTISPELRKRRRLSCARCGTHSRVPDRLHEAPGLGRGGKRQMAAPHGTMCGNDKSRRTWERRLCTREKALIGSLWHKLTTAP